MKKTIFILILCLLIPLAGCKKERVIVKKQTSKKTEIIKEKERALETEEKSLQKKYYAYDSRGRRDPFLSLVKGIKQKPKKKKGATPIESVSIENIKLIAIAKDEERYYALIMLPDRKTFTITKGMVLGLEGGKVEEITSEKVVIREYLKDYRGNIEIKDTVLKLHKGD